MSGQVATAALPHLAFAAQLALGIVFLLSALPKLRRPRAFVRSVAAYEILPPGVAQVFALALIPTEVALALAFLTGSLVGVALPLAAAVLLAFLVAVGINLRRGRRVTCGCFGEASEEISPRTTARLLLLLTVVLLLAAFRGARGASWPGPESPPADVSTLAYLLQVAALAAFLILLAAWLLRLPEMVAIARQLRWSRPAAGDTGGEAGVEGA